MLNYIQDNGDGRMINRQSVMLKRNTFHVAYTKLGEVSVVGIA